MSISGLVVCTKPASLAALATRLSAMPGLKVHQRDPATGRIVVTLEAASVDEEIEGVQRIRSLPDVVSADLVYHRVAGESDTSPARQPGRTPGTQRGET